MFDSLPSMILLTPYRVEGVVYVICLELSKAFDIVFHNKPVTYESRHRLDGLQTERKTVWNTRFNGQWSKGQSLTSCDIPQGTILGLILLNTFTSVLDYETFTSASL